MIYISYKCLFIFVLSLLFPSTILTSVTLIQKVELKVSVNCCDGCKKKVKKVLQSIEGNKYRFSCSLHYPAPAPANYGKTHYQVF